MSIKNPRTGIFFVGIVSDCLRVCNCIIILYIMRCLRYLLFLSVVMRVPVAYAYPDGLQIGVGASALSGMNVYVGYKYQAPESWMGKFGARFDFADSAALKSAIDSAIDHIMSDGVDVGNGVKIDDGKLEASHYALLIDFYPFDSWWRLTGGIMWGNLELNAAIKGEIAEVPSERFYFYINGDHYYYNGNRFRGNTAIDWSFYGPYLGAGVDVDLFCGFKFFVDIGAVVTNRPARLSLDIPYEQLYIYNTDPATWSPVTIPKLDTDVDAAERDANHKLSDLRIYPVVKLGVSYQF